VRDKIALLGSGKQKAIKRERSRMTSKFGNKHKTLSVWRTAFGLVVAVMFVRHDAAALQAPIALGSTATFGVLAGTTVTTIPTTTINGDLGVSPGNTVTGSPIVNGTLHLGDPAAAQAQLDLTTAYNDAKDRTVEPVSMAGNLGGLTLAPGLYKSTSSLEISSGDLTLDASGDPNAVWIFQMASTLVTTVGRQVILSGGAQAANVYWQVGSSATIGGNSVFKGTILAAQSITMNTGATLEGRVLARVGAVALDANTITVPNAVTAPVTLLSSSVVTGPYTDASGQSVNLATKTITVPASGSMQFYRIRSGTALTIKSITVSSANTVITYN
jgi:hypothetical protein